MTPTLTQELDTTVIDKMLAIADADGNGSINFAEFKELMQIQLKRGFLV